MWVHNESEEILSEVSRLHDLSFQCFLLADLLVDEPLSLILSNIRAAQLLLLFDLVEIVNDHTYKHVHNEQRAGDHDYYKVN